MLKIISLPPGMRFAPPQAVLAEAEAQIPFGDDMAMHRFFKDPRMQLLRDQWCAGKLSTGYQAHVRPCLVAVNPSAERMDADFFLQTAGRHFAFQSVARHEPDRRIANDYLALARRGPRMTHIDHEVDQAALWLAEAVKAKAKRYGPSPDMNLVVYANFFARQVQFAEIAMAVLPWRQHFGSLWIFTGTHICSIWSTLELGQIVEDGNLGWGRLDGLPASATQRQSIRNTGACRAPDQGQSVGRGPK
jgi:hypothetical protein